MQFLFRAGRRLTSERMTYLKYYLLYLEIRTKKFVFILHRTATKVRAAVFVQNISYTGRLNVLYIKKVKKNKQVMVRTIKRQRVK